MVKNSFVVTVSVSDISVLVANITFVVVEIIFKEDVITASVAEITYIVAEITFKVTVVNSSAAKITFVVDETTVKVAAITPSSINIIFPVAKIIFCWKRERACVVVGRFSKIPASITTI